MHIDNIFISTTEFNIMDNSKGDIKGNYFIHPKNGMERFLFEKIKCYYFFTNLKSNGKHYEFNIIIPSFQSLISDGGYFTLRATKDDYKPMLPKQKFYYINKMIKYLMDYILIDIEDKAQNQKDYLKNMKYQFSEEWKIQSLSQLRKIKLRKIL